MAKPQIENYLNRELGLKDTVSTAFEETGFLFMISGKTEKGGKKEKAIPNAEYRVGPDFEIPVRNRERNAEMFLVGSTGDYIGEAGDPSTVLTATYKERDPVKMAKAFFATLKNDLRINEIQLKRAQSKRELLPFMKNNLETHKEDTCELIASQIINGTSDGQQNALVGIAGASALDMYGLIYQDRVYSGVAGTNVNNNPANTHMGLVRSEHRELVGNVLSALSVDPAGDGATFLEVLDVEFRQGETSVSLNGAAVDFTNYIGWNVYADLQGGTNYKPLGRGYVVGDATIGGTDTKIQLGYKWEQIDAGDNSDNPAYVARPGTNGLGIQANIQLRPWFDGTIHGDAGVLTINKLIRAGRAANSGKRRANLAGLSEATYSRIIELLQTQERFVDNMKSNKTLETANYESIIIAGVTFCPDNYWPDGEIHFYNTKYVKPFIEKGFDSFELKAGDLKKLTDGRSVKSIGAALVASMQVMVTAPNTGSVLKDFNI
jgi:hypothetical protein